MRQSLHRGTLTGTLVTTKGGLQFMAYVPAGPRSGRLTHLGAPRGPTGPLMLDAHPLPRHQSPGRDPPPPDFYFEAEDEHQASSAPWRTPRGTLSGLSGLSGLTKTH
jgi:hypothetical protein